jgi:hypothetical protein
LRTDGATGVSVPATLAATGVDRFRPLGLLIGPTGRHRPGAFLDRTEERTDGDRLAVLGGDIGEYTGCGRRHLDRDLVGLEFHHRLVDGHHVAGLLEPLADRRLGHRLAKGGHANLSHGLIPRSPDRWHRDNGRHTTEDGEEILDLSLVVLRRR